MNIQDYENLWQHARTNKNIKLKHVYIARENEYLRVGFTYTLAGIAATIRETCNTKIFIMRDESGNRPKNWFTICEDIKKQIVESLEIGNGPTSKELICTKFMAEAEMTR